MRAIVMGPHGVRLHGVCVTVKLWPLKGTRIQGDLCDSCTPRGSLDEGGEEESFGLIIEARKFPLLAGHRVMINLTDGTQLE